MILNGEHLELLRIVAADNRTPDAIARAICEHIGACFGCDALLSAGESCLCPSPIHTDEDEDEYASACVQHD